MIALAALGKVYQDGEVVCRQGEPGDVLFVVQEGQLEIVREEGGRETLLRVAGKHELVGEMAVFDRVARSATVRAKGTARVLTLDKRNFMRRLNEDPTLAFRMIETMARRVRELSTQVVALRAELRAKG
jgi:CRP/FNR family cyclic AMP-dependent transcriptional regulator